MITIRKVFGRFVVLAEIDEAIALNNKTAICDGSTPHEALKYAHESLRAELEQIQTLMGYSESLLAKEVQGGKGEE